MMRELSGKFEKMLRKPIAEGLPSIIDAYLGKTDLKIEPGDFVIPPGDNDQLSTYTAKFVLKKDYEWDHRVFSGTQSILEITYARTDTPIRTVWSGLYVPWATRISSPYHALEIASWRVR